MSSCDHRGPNASILAAWIVAPWSSMSFLVGLTPPFLLKSGVLKVAHAILRDMIGVASALMAIGQLLLARHLQQAKIGPDFSWPNGEADLNNIPGVSFIIVLSSAGVTGYAGECRRSMWLICSARRKRKKKTPYHSTPYHTVASCILLYDIGSYRIVQWHTSYIILQHIIPRHTTPHRIIPWLRISFCITPNHTVS